MPIAAATGRPTRNYRAAAALLLTGVFTLLVAALHWRTISSVPAIGLVTVAGPVIGAVVQLVIAAGLAWGSSWASAAMTPALWIVALSGAFTFLVSLAGGRLDIPIGVFLAVWALRAQPLPGTPDHAPGRAVSNVVARTLVATLLIVAAWPVIAPATKQPGGPLIASAADIRLELEASPCIGEAGVADSPPEAIEVVLRAEVVNCEW